MHMGPSPVYADAADDLALDAALAILLSSSFWNLWKSLAPGAGIPEQYAWLLLNS